MVFAFISFTFIRIGVRRVQDGIKIITEKLSSKYHRVQCGAKVVAVYPDKVFFKNPFI